MTKFLLIPALMLAATSSFAAGSVQKFTGNFKLVDSKTDNNAFCFEGIAIREDKGLVSIYRSDISGYGPMISAELNGEARETSGSHGEAMSSSKGTDTVTLKNDILTFEYKGITKLFGIPAGRESDTLAIQIAKDGKTLAVTRTTFEGSIAGIGTKGTALCVYR